MARESPRFHDAHAEPASPARPGLMDLPPEVRHEIYKHLFCHKPSPITLSHQDFYAKWAHFSPFLEPQQQEQPTFYTALFRVNKAISRDALQFAYSANSFKFDKDIETFCKLGSIALASIKCLRVYRDAWLDSSYATAFWETVNRSCSSLELLIVEAASHVLLSAIPYMKDFMASIPPGQPKPSLILDLIVLDRHFSFDFPDHDYRSAIQDLQESTKGRGNGGDGESVSLHYKYAMRLPKHTKDIRFLLDIGAGAFRALDETLSRSADLCFVQADDIPHVGGHDIDGRGKRHCFVWQETCESTGGSS